MILHLPISLVKSTWRSWGWYDNLCMTHGLLLWGAWVSTSGNHNHGSAPGKSIDFSRIHSTLPCLSGDCWCSFQSLHFVSLSVCCLNKTSNGVHVLTYPSAALSACEGPVHPHCTHAAVMEFDIICLCFHHCRIYWRTLFWFAKFHQSCWTALWQIRKWFKWTQLSNLAVPCTSM